MPFIKELEDNFGDNFKPVFTNRFDSLEFAMDKLENEFGHTDYINYVGEPASVWANLGFSGGYPTSALFDRDGNVRLQAVGAVDGAPQPSGRWRQTVSECTGIPE